MILGIHVSGDVEDMANVVKWGCSVFQLFLKLHNKKINYGELKKFCKKYNLTPIVHASYTINIARNWTLHDSWIIQFIRELEKATDISAPYIIVHTGARLKISEKTAYNNMLTSLLYVVNNVPDSKTKILIETTAGQG